MMSMSMQMTTSLRQRQRLDPDEENLKRQARVALFRTRRGELVKIHAGDPVLPYYLELANAPIAHGNPIGAIPEAL